MKYLQVFHEVSIVSPQKSFTRTLNTMKQMKGYKLIQQFSSERNEIEASVLDLAR